MGNRWPVLNGLHPVDLTNAPSTSAPDSRLLTPASRLLTPELLNSCNS